MIVTGKNGYYITGNHGTTERVYRVENAAGKTVREFAGQSARREAIHVAGVLPLGDVPEPEQPSQPAPVALPKIGEPLDIETAIPEPPKAKPKAKRKPKKRKAVK